MYVLRMFLWIIILDNDRWLIFEQLHPEICRLVKMKREDFWMHSLRFFLLYLVKCPEILFCHIRCVYSKVLVFKEADQSTLAKLSENTNVLN